MLKTFSDIPFLKDDHQDILTGYIVFENGFEMKIKQLYVEEINKTDDDPGEWFVSVLDHENNPFALPGIRTLEYLTKNEVENVMIIIQEIGKGYSIADDEDKFV